MVEGEHWGPGLIAEIGSGPHLFGGNRWAVAGSLKHLGDPVVLACLDLRDPRLASAMFPESMTRLPLASYINHDGLLIQRYSVDDLSQSIRILDVSGQACPLPESGRIFVPIPETKLSLRPMVKSEIPTDKDSDQAACDSLVGGSGFFRIGGPPVWLQGESKVSCRCERAPTYLAALGYESYDKPQGYLGGADPFFLGEMALYFLWCEKCELVTVEMQST